MRNENKPTAYTHQDSQPWYKNYMVVIFVIGLPLFVVVACIWFVFYSVQVKDTVVRDDWYMDGKTLYQDVSRDELAADLDLKGSLKFDEHVNNENNIVFNLIYPATSLESGKLLNNAPLYYPESLNLSISHATDINKDRDTKLIHQSGNTYVGHIDLDKLPSKYYLQVSNEDELNWRLQQMAKLPQAQIEFKPLASFD